MEYLVGQTGKTINVNKNGCYLGIDFGTTNSILSFLDIKEFNDGSVNVEAAAFRESVDQMEYIPTVVTYDKKKGGCTIGRGAKRNVGRKNMESYDCFKLQLGQNFRKPLRENGKTAEEVTCVYLEELLNKFKKQQGVTVIDQIVATIPETWFRESSNRTARENIRGIYEKLGYKREQIHLQSEPVAACAYYCWRYFETLKKAYQGHIMVVDYGGGTLDVTLCEVSNGFTIKVLERCGAGEYKDTNGCAGVAFDEAVTKTICEENGLTLDENQFSKLRNRFEQEKITQTEVVEKKLRDGYYMDEDVFRDEEVFTVEYQEEDYEVNCGHLGEAFERINIPPLTDAVNQMKEFFPMHQVDEENGDRFQVLLIGGFSNFYGVEHEVRKAFRSEANFNDNRFGTYQLEDGRRVSVIDKADRSLAVSKGAALIAADVVSVDPSCPYNIGITVVKQGMSMTVGEMVDFIILEKGRALKDCMAPQFFDKKIVILNQNVKLQMFLDDGRANGKGMVRFLLDKDCSDIFPNINVSGNQYMIGVSMDSDMVAFLYIRDDQEENVISLQSLIERVSVRVAD